MFVVGQFITRLGRWFVISTQPQHPDQCGGFEPVGSLCLLNALIVSCAGIQLGGWIAISHFGSGSFQDVADTWEQLYAGLLIVPIVVAAMSFVLPIKSIHDEMVVDLADHSEQLNDLSKQIQSKESELLQLADELSPDDQADRIKQLESLHETYRRNERFPTWPVNTRIITKFGAAQLVPLLGLTQVAGEGLVNQLFK
jgi:hypothetical protein